MNNHKNEKNKDDTTPPKRLSKWREFIRRVKCRCMSKKDSDE